MRHTMKTLCATLVCAVLAACGGGGDGTAEGSLTTDGTSVAGSFATCAPVGEPIAFASTQTRLDVTETTLRLSLRHHLGTRCSGPALVTLSFPLVLLAPDGTQTVAGPSAGTSVTALKVRLSGGAGQVTWEGDGNYVRVRNNQIQVIEPNTGVVLYSEDMASPAVSEKSLFALVGTRLYRGNTAYDAQGYPSGLDFSHGWERL